jgi:peroxiredoxin Q/BCP
LRKINLKLNNMAKKKSSSAKAPVRKAIKKTAKKAARKSAKKAAVKKMLKKKPVKKFISKKAARKAPKKAAAKKNIQKTAPANKKIAVKRPVSKKKITAKKTAPKKTILKKKIIKTGNHSLRKIAQPKIENVVMEQVEIIVATPILETIEINGAETAPEFKQHVTSLREGMVAPYFEGLDQFGNLIRSSDYIGKTIVLYFYPKDFTEGCTAEACSLRDEYQYLENNNYVVIGVSADSVESHKEFSDELNLPFSIIADTAHNIINAYDVWGPKQLAGKIYDGIVRTTFVIDPDGIIQNVVTKVDSAHHAQQLLNL